MDLGVEGTINVQEAAGSRLIGGCSRSHADHGCLLTFLQWAWMRPTCSGGLLRGGIFSEHGRITGPAELSTSSASEFLRLC